MDSLIRYQFGAIEQAAGDITATSGRITSVLDNLKQLLAPMVSTWEGDSAAAYQQAQAQWDQAAVELNEVLATIARTVSEGNSRMSDINRRAAASWS